MRSRRGINYRNDLDVDLSMDITKHPAVPPWFLMDPESGRCLLSGIYISASTRG